MKEGATKNPAHRRSGERQLWGGGGDEQWGQEASRGTHPMGGTLGHSQLCSLKEAPPTAPPSGGETAISRCVPISASLSDSASACLLPSSLTLEW